ncbi:hydrogenase maturation protease [Aquabacterium sp.]|uniref:hydrogenase maturation protease n=1 Tax=Aquabacterium sp. TaxID=1872578 RepID=UPI0035B48DDF
MTAPTASGIAPIVVFAIGNPSRGDDAIGPLLGERLQAELARRGWPAQAQVEVIAEQQLVVEHVLDLVGRQAALFLDAAAQGAEPVSLITLEPALAPVVTSHRVSPTDLLGLFRAHMRATPPPAELLAVVADGFELGAALSAAGRERLEAAWTRLQAWVDDQTRQIR